MGVGVGGKGVPSSLMSLFIWEPERAFLRLLLNVFYRPSLTHSRRWGRNNKHTARCQTCPPCLDPMVHLAFTEDLEMKGQEGALLVP